MNINLPFTIQGSESWLHGQEGHFLLACVAVLLSPVSPLLRRRTCCTCWVSSHGSVCTQVQITTLNHGMQLCTYSSSIGMTTITPVCSQLRIGASIEPQESGPGWIIFQQKSGRYYCTQITHYKLKVECMWSRYRVASRISRSPTGGHTGRSYCIQYRVRTWEVMFALSTAVRCTRINVNCTSYI